MKSSLFSILVPACMMLSLASCSGREGDGRSFSPSFVSDSATVNITVVDHDSTGSGYIDAIVSLYEGLDELAPRRLDAEGRTTIDFDLHGDAVLTLYDTHGDRRYGEVRIAPGEVTDVVIYPDSIVTTGRFAEFNRVLNSYKPRYGIDFFNSDFVRYDMNGDDYTAAITGKYKERLAAMEADASLTDVQRIIERGALVNNLLTMAGDRKFIGRCSYLTTHPESMNVPLDSIATDMSDANYAAVLSVIDPDDEAMMMDPGVATAGADVDWNANGASGTLLGVLSAYRKVAEQAHSGKMSPELTAVLSSYPSTFFAEAVEDIRAKSEKRIEEVSRMVSPTPEVAPEKIIEAIAAKYPGKVVFIDRWNTWCGPCKAAIAENEPLKQTVLANPDIVWVYVADESSPLPAYYNMIPDIKGEHYRLNEEQSRAVYDRYKIDGIPYYFLAGRDGKLTPRPDLRDHELLVSTILEELNK